jgi:hypothetical protein
MRWVTKIATLALTLAAGCMGSYQSGSPGTPGDPGTPGTPGTPGSMGSAGSAQALFNQNILPMLGACSGCHAGTSASGGPKFMGDGTAVYASLVADPRFVNNVPQDSYLITHHHAPGEGPDLTTGQDMNVIQWITQENVERALPPPPAPANQAAMELAKFGQCMTQTDYNSSGMNDLQNNGTNGNGGPCTSCHQTGAYVYLSVDPNQNFLRLQQSPYIMKFALPSVNPDGTFKDIVAADRFLNRGKEVGHVAYTLTTARQQALTTFFQDTYNRYKAGNCPTTPAPTGP